MDLKERLARLDLLKRQLSNETLPRELTDQDVRQLQDAGRRANSAARALEEILAARARVAIAKEKAEAAEAKLQLLRITERRRLLEAKGQPGQRHGPSGGLEPVITDRAIQALAARAVVRFSALPPAEAERAWQLWREELNRRLPQYAATEVAQLAAQLRELSS